MFLSTQRLISKQFLNIYLFFKNEIFFIVADMLLSVIVSVWCRISFTFFVCGLNPWNDGINRNWWEKLIIIATEKQNKKCASLSHYSKTKSTASIK